MHLAAAREPRRNTIRCAPRRFGHRTPCKLKIVLTRVERIDRRVWPARDMEVEDDRAVAQLLGGETSVPPRLGIARSTRLLYSRFGIAARKPDFLQLRGNRSAAHAVRCLTVAPL